MESKKYTMDFAGRPLTLEFGRYCEQANGSVWVWSMPPWLPLPVKAWISSLSQ